MKHVLIVEDHEENRNLLKLLLEVNGYRVSAAGNGAEALAAARSAAPDAIVSDVLMPTMDGFALCRAWMQDEALRAIPFIFYSATYVRPDDEKYALALGAVRYLIKPLEADVFLGELRAVLGQWAGRPAPAPAPPLDDAASRALHEAALARKLEDKMAQLEAANRKLRESEEKYRRIFDSVQDVYVETSLDGIILEISPQLATLSQGQYKREDIIGTSVDALYADAEYRDAILSAIKQHGRAIDVDSTFRNRDGSLIPCSVSATVVRSAEGESRIVATLRDISRRKADAGSLLETEARCRSLMQQWFDGMCVVQEQKLVWCNPRLADILGYAAEADLIGKALASLACEEDFAATAEALRRLIEEEPGPLGLAFAAVRKDGSLIRLELQGARGTYLGRPAVLAAVRAACAKERAGQALEDN
ncbi:MAG: PAS domain S-box protein [Burkholderiales bacterium]|jgi:PAS domain S-box-containing protein